MILVDFDRTLATYESWEKNGANLGEPIKPMVERVKAWLGEGKSVRIFTARAAITNPRRSSDIAAIELWCEKHLGQRLIVQNWKDFSVEAIYDDLAWHVEPNEGTLVS